MEKIYQWVVEPIPAPLNWFFAALAIAGCVMAVQPFLQAWVRPRIMAKVDYHYVGMNKVIRLYATNLPLRTHLARALMLKRPNADAVTARFRILEKGSGKVIYDWLSPEWIPRHPQHMYYITDFHIGTPNYFGFAWKIAGYSEVAILADEVADQLGAINGNLEVGATPVAAFTRPIGIGVFQVQIVLSNSDFIRSFQFDLHNEGVDSESFWISDSGQWC